MPPVEQEPLEQEPVEKEPLEQEPLWTSEFTVMGTGSAVEVEALM